jgi:hypothetical protein
LAEVGCGLGKVEAEETAGETGRKGEVSNLQCELAVHRKRLLREMEIHRARGECFFASKKPLRLTMKLLRYLEEGASLIAQAKVLREYVETKTKA